MRTWDVDVVVTFAERVMSGNTLRASHKKFPGTGISQTCKGKEEFKVTIVEAGEVLTWQVLKTGLHKIAYLEARLVQWYVQHS